MGFFEKLKKGLSKTKNAIVGKIDELFKSFRKVDEELFEGLSNGSSSKLYYYEFSDRENREGVAMQIEDELYGGYRCEYHAGDHRAQRR